MDTSLVLGELAAAGVNAWPESRRSFATDTGRSIFVSLRSRPPTPADIERDLGNVGDGWMLYQVRSITPGLRDVLRSDDRVIVWDDETSTLWLNRVEHRHGAQDDRLPRGRRPYVRLAIARALLLEDQPRRQVEIAASLGVPQSAVSQGVKHLGDLVERVDRGYVAADARELWAYVMRQYPGPGGITTYWWHDASLEDQARMVGQHADAIVSGDLAARAIAPWRRPEHATLYLREGIDPSALGFAMGSPGDHTLSITVPDDVTVFATAETFGSSRGLADAVIAAYDVAATGTTGDHQEAAERIRDAVIRHRDSGR